MAKMAIFKTRFQALKVRNPMAKICAASIALLMVGLQVSSVTAQVMSDYTALPRTLDDGVAPMVMLAMSNDHQLYYRAYTDFDDINDNGQLDPQETNYDNNLNYVGYFESAYCYSYANEVFTIAGPADNHYCDASPGDWSGNFLNWATMTRIDVLRKILYGGKRSVQDQTQTVLERSYLPNDAHSFAKYYNKADLPQLTPFEVGVGSDRDIGVTLCNTTLHIEANQKTSLANTNPPLMRAIQGNYAFWSASERYQCLQHNGQVGDEGLYDPFNAFGVAVAANDTAVVEQILTDLSDTFGLQYLPHFDSPQPADRAGPLEIDYVIRVVACPVAYAPDIPSCKAYGTIYRPTGLLHKYGESGEILWGLITGSYIDNKEGGYLRKNVVDISDEIDPVTGRFCTQGDLGCPAERLIENIDSLRIAGWREDNDNNTSYNAPAGSNCFWGNANFTNGNCLDWGNPLGEILQESYNYFAEAEFPTFGRRVGNVEREDNRAPAGVTIAPWTPNLICPNVSLNVVGLNTSANSFDGLNDVNQNGASHYGGEFTTDAIVSALTDAIGTTEGVTGGTFFVGEAPGGQNQGLCSPKVINNLSTVLGSCPQAPRLDGSWKMIGAAQYAYDQDINDNLEDGQSVVTHGIELSTALPRVSIFTPGSTTNSVTIIPMCQNTKGGNCAIVDFKVLGQDVVDIAGVQTATGAFYVNWEDSEQGGDYDQDVHGIIEYEIGPHVPGINNVKIKTRVIGQSTQDQMAFGYVLSGTGASDGPHAHSGVGPAFGDGYTGFECINCRINGAAQTEANYATADTAISDLLDSPLRFAAKYGGGKFVRNNNPEQLESDFEEVFSDLGKRPAAGGSEVAATSDSAGANLFLHTIYYAQLEEGTGAGAERVNWIGQVGALFLDQENRLVEDTNGNASLDAGDFVIQFSDQMDANGQPLVLKFAFNAADDAEPNVTTTIDDISYIWSTTQSLDAVDPADRRIFTQQINATQGTPLDTDVTAGQVIAFNPGLGNNANYAALLGNTDSPPDLIRYIRGVESNDFRSRTLGDTIYRLGDILTSPVIQGAPDFSYYSEFGDADYLTYQTTYKNERKIVYVASNDGMIHAFNAGTYNALTQSYAPGTINNAPLTLGEELWSYVPFNLLPHMQWLADRGYQHVPYFDGYMRTFDVKIFNDDAIHPGGWGTILVVGTGLGGGAYPVDLDGDLATPPEITTRPAYIVLDITDRNALSPTLIAEISHEQLGFTTGEPDVTRYVTANSDDNGDWFLVFGTGARGYDQASARAAQLNYVIPDLAANNVLLTDNVELEKPRLFAFNLNSRQLQDPVRIDRTDDNAFVGGIKSMDWNRDFLDNALYFGTISGDQANPDGQLMRARLRMNGGNLVIERPSIVIDTEKPVTTRPTTVIDNLRNYWVFAGTGRYFVREDANPINSGNIYVGVIEHKDNNVGNGAVSDGDIDLDRLYNATPVRVFEGGALFNAGQTVAAQPQDIDSVDVLRAEISRNYEGWYREFDANERQHTITGFLAATLFVSTTTPGQSQTCGSSDEGKVYVMDMRSGVFSPFLTNFAEVTSPFTGQQGQTVNEVIGVIETAGAGTDINDPTVTLINTTGGGVTSLPELEINVPSVRYSWREVPLTW
jgi:type IV pilus assembly protein PilY1